MISITFVEQPERASTRHHHTVNRTRAAAALPKVIGGLGSDFTTDRQGLGRRQSQLLSAYSVHRPTRPECSKATCSSA